MNIQHREDITPEIIAGLERFTSNEVPMKLTYESHSAIFYDLDSAWCEANTEGYSEEELHFFVLLLPHPLDDAALYPPVGAILHSSRQWKGQIAGERLAGCDFEVTRHEWDCEHSTTLCRTSVTVYLKPVLSVGEVE